LKRLVAIELKVGKFVPQYAGQTSFYLKWLNKHERQADEKLDKSGIAVAEYWTELPPKALLEEKIKLILAEAD
jgi:hypothetical protein